MAEVQQLLQGDTYINVHTTDNPGGAIRGQIVPTVVDNHFYVDEIDNKDHNGQRQFDEIGSIPLLKYQGPNNQYNGTVAMAHRQQPSLENPGITNKGRSVYATFGLEGMSNTFNSTLAVTPTTRSELLGMFLDWGWSEPATTVNISDTVVVSSTMYIFNAAAAYDAQASSTQSVTPAPVHYRWDFGDGSAYATVMTAQANHIYHCNDQSIYTVRVEITDNFGNVVIGNKSIDIGDNCSTAPVLDQMLYLPIIHR
ncbi:MAG: PKD domain-containing protein [Caldilineaceae bacterium]